MTSIYRFSYADADTAAPTLTPIEKAETRKWQYATMDPVACAFLAEKLGESCIRGRPITYAELSRGATFTLPDGNGGSRYVMDISDGKYINSSDQFILDDFLCFLSLQSAKGAGILASANVMDPREKNLVPKGFLATATLLGFRRDVHYPQTVGRGPGFNEQMEQAAFWVKEQKKAYAWFKQYSAESI